MRMVFLDSVGLLAVWDVNDRWHSAARAVYVKLMEQKAKLFTTTFVMLECVNAAARRSYKAGVVELHDAMQKRGCLLVPTADDWNEAWRKYEQNFAGDASIVDHVSFILMRQLGIDAVFANDRHFSAAGFQILF